MLPANGIYACRATLNGEQFMAATSVGERPTFDGKDVRVEAYLLDFDRVIYGETLALDFVARLRDEKRFESVEALVLQIEKDVEVTRSLLTGQEA